MKFQTHIAEAESTAAEPWRVRFTNQDNTRLDYWRRMEFSEAHWRELAKHAEARGLLFLSSAFSPEAVDLLSRVGVAGWKIASGETSNHLLIDTIARKSQPIIISTGMSTFSEIDAVLARIEPHDVPVALLQCTSAYPCPPEQVGLNVISEFRARYGCAVGLSDHSATIFPALAAATLGINVLEVHLTLSRAMFGPDVIASVTPRELRTIVEGVRAIETMRAHPVDKTQLPESVQKLRDVFTKSVVAARALPAGTVLCAEHLAVKKPGTGIAANHLPTLIGKRLNRSLDRDEQLQHTDLEGLE